MTLWVDEGGAGRSQAAALHKGPLARRTGMRAPNLVIMRGPDAGPQAGLFLSQKVWRAAGQLAIAL